MADKFSILDLHCDTALEIMGGHSLYDNDKMISIKKMQEGGLSCQFFALFVKLAKHASVSDAYDHLLKLHKALTEEFNKNQEYLTVAHNAKEISAVTKEGKIAAVLTIEEGAMVDNKLERLDEFYKMGVRLMTLTWNYENCIGFPNSIEPELMQKGLKPFGKEVVKRMQEIGMLVDVSHLSDGGFWDVVKLSKKPFVASHSNARSLCSHQRNMTDEMIKALADAGGVIGINYVPNFLGADETGKIEKMVKHIKYIHKIAGLDVLAMGSDFDGYTQNCEIIKCSDLPRLTDAISKAGYSDDEIEKICWKNAMRVIETI